MNEIKIVNATTGEEIIREMTAKEAEDLEKAQAEVQARQAQEAQAAADRNSAIEKLSALGLTEAEIQALAG